MYGDFLLLDDGATDARASAQRVERLAFGDTAGRDEAWLRDTLLAHPGLLPVRQIDPSFGPLLPLCRELRTEAGPVDAVFINPQGRLTLVECKLWRNPEARRKVVAQILDYARVISRWSYADLQRQVSMATGRHGNLPFETARSVEPALLEHEFVDQASRALRQGRFLLLIAGDGIREDVGAITELITRNAALGFSFGLVELALYGMPDGRLLAQPRVTAATRIVERTVVVLRDERVDSMADPARPVSPAVGDPDDASGVVGNALGESPKQAEYRRWWQPVLDAPLDDPEQEPARLHFPNHVRLPLPRKDTWITAYRTGGAEGDLGVTIGGRNGADDELLRALSGQMPEILSELPEGTALRPSPLKPGWTLLLRQPAGSFENDDARREWLIEKVNQFVNVLRPRISGLSGGLTQARS